MRTLSLSRLVVMVWSVVGFASCVFAFGCFLCHRRVISAFKLFFVPNGDLLSVV